jgi:hypothetical protein
VVGRAHANYLLMQQRLAEAESKKSPAAQTPANPAQTTATQNAATDASAAPVPILNPVSVRSSTEPNPDRQLELPDDPDASRVRVVMEGPMDTDERSMTGVAAWVTSADADSALVSWKLSMSNRSDEPARYNAILHLMDAGGQEIETAHTNDINLQAKRGGLYYGSLLVQSPFARKIAQAKLELVKVTEEPQAAESPQPEE